MRACVGSWNRAGRGQVRKDYLGCAGVDGGLGGWTGRNDSHQALA